LHFSKIAFNLELVSRVFMSSQADEAGTNQAMKETETTESSIDRH
jgi:hypothetical protein